MAATTDTAGETGTPDWDPQRLLDTPLGHELQAFARRVLGPGPAASEAVRAAVEHPAAGRLEAIGQTAAQCRNRDGETVALAPLHGASMAEAVAVELERANAALPNRQREVLALRELLRLGYAQIGAVMGLEEPAVAALLARARLNLREEMRGPYRNETAPCPERDRALRILARRQDSEPLDAVDDSWILAHMGVCSGCERAHAVMLETSFRYRVWSRR